MKTRRLLIGFGLLLLLILGLVGLNIYRGFHSGKRIDVTALTHRDHPLFSGPKRTDGSIDYVASLDRLYGADVIEAQNFAVAMLELEPNSEDWNASTRQQHADKIAFDEDHPKRLLSYQQIAKQLRIEPDKFAMLRDGSENYPTGSARVPLESAFDLIEGSLDECLLQLDRRPDYFLPSTVDTAHQTLVANDLSHFQGFREFARWLDARSNRSLANGQLDAAWRDIREIFQLANRLSQGSKGVEFILATHSHARGCEQLCRLLNHANISEDLLRKIRLEQTQVGVLNSFARSVNLRCRAELLDLIDHNANQLIREEERVLWSTFGQGGMSLLEFHQLPWGWVNSNQMANDWNRVIDDLLEFEELQTLEQAMPAVNRILATMEHNTAWETLIGKVSIGMPPRTEVTGMAENLAATRLVPDIFPIRDFYENDFRYRAHCRLIRLLLSARLLELQTGQLPDSLSELESMVAEEDFWDPRTGRPFHLEITRLSDGRLVDWRLQPSQSAGVTLMFDPMLQGLDQR